MHVDNLKKITLDSKSLLQFGGAHGVILIVVGSGDGDTSSNPERD